MHAGQGAAMQLTHQAKAASTTQIDSLTWHAQPYRHARVVTAVVYSIVQSKAVNVARALGRRAVQSTKISCLALPGWQNAAKSSQRRPCIAFFDVCAVACCHAHATCMQYHAEPLRTYTASGYGAGRRVHLPLWPTVGT